MKNSSRASHRTSFIASSTAVGFSAAFLVILFLLHFLKPELAPSWRMISEYEIGRYGWMMRLAFFCWGGSVLSLVVALWDSLRTVGGKIGYVWLILIGIALFGVGIFVTNESLTQRPALQILCTHFVEHS